MKKPSAKSSAGLRREYDFDYSESKPNRFASRMKGGMAVVLEPDVAAVFTSASQVNRFLRTTIKATAVPAKKTASASRT